MKHLSATALLVLLAACSTRTSTTSTSRVDSDDSGRIYMKATANGDEDNTLELIIAPEVGATSDDTLSIQVESDGERARALPGAVSIGGHPVEISLDELRIGETSYGELVGKVRIEIQPDGVYVNGEHRGALPVPVETEGS